MKESKFILRANGQWSHSPRFKPIINNLLRKIQFYNSYDPYVIASVVEFEHNKQTPTLLGYKFTRVPHK